MIQKIARAFWQYARALLFYPAAIGIMVWLTITGKHWIWGVTVLAAVLILDPIYRIILGSILSWRPHNND